LLGEFTLAGVKITCTSQQCPAGQYSTKIAATSATDGCTDCGAGKWSGTGSKTTCETQECPAGQ